MSKFVVYCLVACLALLQSSVDADLDKYYALFCSGPELAAKAHECMEKHPSSVMNILVNCWMSTAPEMTDPKEFSIKSCDKANGMAAKFVDCALTKYHAFKKTGNPDDVKIAVDSVACYDPLLP